MDVKSIGLIVALIAAAVAAFFFGKKSKDTQAIIDGIVPPDALAPSSAEIERRAAAETNLNPPTTIWDEIDRYTRRRTEESGTLTVSTTKPKSAPTAETSEAAARAVIGDPAVAKVVSSACPVRTWEVDYFDKVTRAWSKVYVDAVVSTEAIKAAKTSIGDTGALFSADAVKVG